MDRKTLKVIIIISILLIAFFVRVVPIRLSHWWDETVYLQHAEVFFSGRNNFDEFSFRPPLLSILFFLVFFIKHSVVSASILTALIGTLAPLFVFLIGKKLYGFKVGAIAGLILAFTPFITLNSNYLLTDVPVITFMAISFYCALFKDRNFLLFLSGVFFSLAILMKFTAVLMGVIFLLYFFLQKIKIKKILFFALGAFLILFPYLLIMQIKFGSFLTPFIKGSQMVGDKNEPTFFYFTNLSRAFTSLVLIGVFLWILNLFIQIKNKKYINLKKDLLLIFWIVVFFIYLSKTPHKELRYILPITIPIILLASNGIFLFVRRIRKPYQILFWLFFAGYLLFLISSSYAWENIIDLQFVDYSKSDEMKLADYVLNEMKYTGIIYTNQRWPVIAYYTGLETRLLWPQDGGVYSKIPELMKEDGLLIGMFGVKVPQPVWLDADSRFNFVEKVGDFFIYDYVSEDKMNNNNS